MDSLPWIKAGNKLTLVLENGQHKTISDSDPNYEKVLVCIKIGDWETVSDLLDPKVAIFNFSDGIFEVINNIVHVHGKPVPDGLSKKIILFAKEGLPYKPLLNFWDKLQKNPSFHIVNSLYEFLERNNYPITEDGNIIAYKGIKEDWTDNYTGTISNKIGLTVSMPRNEVNDDPNFACQAGLHVGNYEFASTYGRGGHMIMVSLNPENVVSMPNAYEFTKMRVCEYSVLKEVFNEEKGNLYKEPVDNSKEDEYDDKCPECGDNYGSCSCDDRDELETDDYVECDCYNYSCDEYESHHNSCECGLLENRDQCSFKDELFHD